MLQDIEKKKVLIGVPSASGYMPTQMVQSLMELYKPCQCQLFIIDRVKIDKARNNFIREAIRGGFDYLFMCDDDNPIPNDTLLKMMHADKDIISAPIMTRKATPEGKHELCVFYLDDVFTAGRDIEIYNFVREWKTEGDLQEVDAVGTGVILIKRKVFEQLWNVHKERPFEFVRKELHVPVLREGKPIFSIEYGEDVEFCRRAAKLGFKIWCDLSIRPRHLTSLGEVVYL